MADITIARMLESKLRQFGIPTLIKYKGSGEYLQLYMGSTPFGVDLYVPASVLEKAKEILTPDDDPAAMQDFEEDDTSFEENAQSIPVEMHDLREEAFHKSLPIEEDCAQMHMDVKGGLPKRFVARKFWGALFIAMFMFNIYAYFHFGMYNRVTNLVVIPYFILQVVIALYFLLSKGK